ncbi:MAG TPA: hypothetical protein DEH25_07560 [Chloroflexi bacterium]|nr:hypothetical protein [Chloroflexota bacterium]
MRLEVGGTTPIAHWVYALVAPFPTIPDGVAQADLSAAWAGTLETGPFAGLPLKMDAATYGALTQLWGPSPVAAVEILSPEELLPTSWANQPSWAIIPFEQLDPQWKVLQIEGISPIQKDFDPAAYALTLEFGLGTDPGVAITPLSNRDPDKFTDIMMTGVTALVRGTALTMERKGVLYPGEDIRPLTTAVDIMHVNNEIPFTPDCAFPKLEYDKLVFCSDVRYLDLLLDIGTDVMELSGDHFGDYGPEGTLYTLDLYDEVGLPYYGGGRNLEDGRKPYLIEHNGNKIAFIGCNAKGSHYYAPADETTPGAVPCDFEWLEGEIARLKEAGYLVVMTFQHVEYYSYVGQPDLVRDFGRMAAAGADIVSGSQSHQAHGMAFVDGKFVHYGLGNLFFDQYLFCENAVCDYAFMDRHIIYEGRYISTELIPIRFIDMARPRPMTPEEKAWFLGIIFEASGWK